MIDLSTADRIGIVVIGRNEGERLVRCLESVRGQGRVVYVDSGSTDGSVERARGLGGEVVELDMTRPFTAARARNAGFARLRELEGGVEFVQFVDGDSVIERGWLEAGRGELERLPRAAIVCGRLREREPGRSVFHRLAGMEWDAPVGEVKACGGICLVRSEAMHEVGGFRDEIVAGEEPELCSRLIERGWTIVRVGAPMAVHDMGRVGLRQWWRRQVRAGYGGLLVYRVCAGRRVRPFERQIQSARVWVGVVAGLAVVGVSLGAAVAGWLGALAGVVLGLSIVPLNVARMGYRDRGRAGGLWAGVRIAALNMLGKWPQIAGQARLMLEQRRGIEARLIEHKRVGA